MKIKGIAIIGLLLLACSFAVAGQWSFGFCGVGGSLYCNFEQINNNNTYGVKGIPVNGPIYEGLDNLNACGLSVNATINGFGPFTLPKGVTFGGYKVYVKKGVIYADNIYDAFSDAYTGEQWTLLTPLTCKTKKGQPTYWLGIASFSNFVFGDNSNSLSCTIPAKGKHNGLLITGQAAK